MIEPPLKKGGFCVSLRGGTEGLRHRQLGSVGE